MIQTDNNLTTAKASLNMANPYRYKHINIHNVCHQDIR